MTAWSRVAHGLWQIGGRPWGAPDDARAIRAIHAALDAGVTLFDTAPIYGFGRSEQLLGDALRGRSQVVAVATKCGLSWDDAGRVHHDNSPAIVKRQVEASAKRMRREHVDLVWIHWPDPEVPVEETVGALLQLVDAGLVGQIGVSNFDAELLARAVGAGPVRWLQAPYNALRRDIEEHLLPRCARLDVQTMAYEPLARGLLSGTLAANRRFGKRDVRHRDQRFQGAAWHTALEGVRRLQPLAHELGLSVAQLAVSFVLSQPGIAVAICGTAQPQHIAELARVADRVLSSEERALVIEALGTEPLRTLRQAGLE